MANILITGGAGFIGSQLGWKLLQDGHRVMLIDNMTFGNYDNLIKDGKKFPNFIKDDIRNKSIKKYFNDVDFVFHLAGISSLPVCQEFPSYAIDVNVAGTANVLEIARRANVQRVIFSSTSAVYENNVNFPSSEDQQVSPDLVYAVSKLQAETLCRSYIQNYGLEIAITRYYNVYGPHQDFKRKSPPMTGYIIKELMNNRRPRLYSDGMQKRDYVYIDDVNILNSICMSHPKASGEVFNVASGTACSVQDIYDGIASVFKSKLQPIYAEPTSYWDAYENLFVSNYPLSKKRIEKEVLKYTLGSNKKAKSILNWSPTTTLVEGLKRSVLFAMSENNK